MGKVIRNFITRLNLATLAALLLIFLSLLYVVLVRHNRRFDLTRDQVFTLSPKTLEIVKGLVGGGVQVKAFFKNDQPERELLEELLKNYAYHNTSIRYEFVDPDRNPGEARRYNVDEYGTIVVELGDKRERVREITEEGLTNALLKVTQEKEKTIAFTEGHGEKPLQETVEKALSHLRERLEAENYSVKGILLVREAIPAEASLVVIAGPQSDFLAGEIEMLKRYAEGGGRLLVLLDPPEAPLTRLEEWLKGYGLVLGQGPAIDKLSRIFGGNYLVPVVTQFADHPVTEKFNIACFLPMARAVRSGSEVPEGFRVTELAFTSPGSWAEKDFAEIQKGEVSFGEGDLEGPVSLASAVEKEGSSFRLVAVGDSDFCDNAHLTLSGNKDLALNIIAWLAGEEKLVSIRPKERASTPLILTSAQQKVIFIVPVFVLPLVSLSSGLAVLLWRKKFA